MKGGMRGEADCAIEAAEQFVNCRRRQQGGPESRHLEESDGDIMKSMLIDVDA